MPDELLDAFDDALDPLGPMPRDVVHRDGLWHPVFHCLIVRTSAPSRVLLQRRRRSARSFPGLLDLSATGHLLAGEQPTDGVRELREEIGVIASPAELIAIPPRLMADETGGDDREGRNREIVHPFLLPLDTPIERFDLGSGDVAGLVEIESARLRAILTPGNDDDRDDDDDDGGAGVRVGAGVAAIELGLDGVVRPITCRHTDLVPPQDDLWQTLVSAAERLSGRAG